MWENNQRLLPALSSGVPLMTALQIMSYADALECVREMCFSFFFFFFLVSPLALFYYIYLFIYFLLPKCILDPRQAKGWLIKKWPPLHHQTTPQTKAAPAMFVYFCKPLDSYTNPIHAWSGSEKKKSISKLLTLSQKAPNVVERRLPQTSSSNHRGGGGPPPTNRLESVWLIDIYSAHSKCDFVLIFKKRGQGMLTAGI